MYSFLHKIDWVQLNKDVEDMQYPSKFKPKFTKLIGNNQLRFRNTIFDILASVKPVKVDGKYSATATFTAIPDIIETPYYKFGKEQFRAYFKFVVTMPPSMWIGPGGVGGNPNFSSLVPIMLASYKQTLGIPYESWDFEDPALKHMMNPQLFEMIQFRNVDFSGVDKLDLRGGIQYVAKIDDYYAATRYPTGKKVEIISDLTVRSTHPLALMLSQVWCANVAKRTEYMVLDPNNWDAMPEALDVVVADVAKPRAKPEYVAPF